MFDFDVNVICTANHAHTETSPPPARGELPARVAARHRHRLPPPRDLHLHHARASRGERLCGTDPQRVPGDAAFDAGGGGTLRDDGAHRTGRDALAAHPVVAPHPPKQRPRGVARSGEPGVHAPHGGRPEVGDGAAALLIGL